MAGADSTSALEFGGNPGPGVGTANTESWNGTNWTEVNNLNAPRSIAGGSGSATSALGFGGYQYTSPSGYKALTESWNGTNWTEVNDLNSTRLGAGSAGSKANNSTSFCIGGNIPPTTGASEQWNGSTWTEVGDLNTARESVGGTGTQPAALAFGGGNPSVTSATEEWNTTSNVVKTLTD